ncbi:M20/M25/M40 family metallo-hydrolase [Arthrobacter crusticola]|uniref:M20/M25/M40 family metallo-hydrolase n=1 Tax=Arthrobacter crusticola TaxID=2547960 RepID=A0A4R5TMS0_9MICC|nr:M20/M25/M40 family metallo-hydrolase [Arthrobacter crusticola]TDK23965.1 M20/M25/M40 family metallo-hydrolase [Arthrobacter crusticola]
MDTTHREQHRAAHARIDSDEADMVEEVRRYLRQPGFSDTGVGILESAEMTLSYIQRLGCEDARLIATPGHPVVYGTLRSKRPHAKTLILYGLYDMTPVIAEEWSVDPLGASIVDASKLNLPSSLGEVIVSRAAHNHRGPTLSSLLAIEALLKTEGDVPCNLIFLIEGEEEIGSPSLPGVIEQLRPVLSEASAAWLPCMYEGADQSMTLFRGFKGSLWAELECRGGDWGGTADGRHLWAGHSVWIDSPLTQVVRAVASFLDDQDRFCLDGLDSLNADITEEDRNQARELVARHRLDPFADRDMLQTLNVTRLRGGADLADHLERFMFGVNVNIQGVHGGYEGPSFYTMLPGHARATLDVRFPVGMNGADIADMMRSHLDRRGLNNVTLRTPGGYPAARTQASDPILQAAANAAKEYGVRTNMWPMYNGACPASLFQELGTGLGFSFAGLGQGERPHAPDEFIRTDAIGQLAHFTISYLHAWSEI